MAAKRTRTSHDHTTSSPSKPPLNLTSTDVENAACTLLNALTVLGLQGMHAPLASALLSWNAHAEEQLDASAREEFASAIVEAVMQARMRDPFVHLPDDLVQTVLDFLEIADVSVLREVCKRWNVAGNVALSRMRFVDMWDLHSAGAADEYTRREKRAHETHFVTSRCPAAETIRVVVHKECFTEQEVVMLMMAKPNIKALLLSSRQNRFNPGTPPSIDLMALRAMRPCCSKLQMLTIEFALNDRDYILLAQLLPQLAILQVRLRGNVGDHSSPLLTTTGLIQFMRKAPNLRLLELDMAARLSDLPDLAHDPPVNTKLHHLWISYCQTDMRSLGVILRHVGRELRSIAVLEDDITPPMFHIMSVSCPKLQRVGVGLEGLDLSLADALSQLKELRVLTTMCGLDKREEQMLRSCLPMRSIELFTYQDEDPVPMLRYDLVAREEGIPVCLTRCEDLIRYRHGYWW